jgi:hypothetical protein
MEECSTKVQYTCEGRDWHMGMKVVSDTVVDSVME